MNMFLKGLAADPQCRPYQPASSARSTAPQPADAGLLCQAYMDDLAMFSPTAAHAQSQLDSLDTFLEAYGMRLNAAKCRHTAVNYAPVPQPRPPLCVRATHTSGGARVPIPHTSPTDTFEYLGHLINQNGDWAPQEAALAVKLGAAMQQVRLASGNKACHTLWTAMFTECDGGSVLPYYMAATGYSESCLKKLDTTLAEACRARAAIDEHVARANLFGQPQHKGLGITSSRALEAGIKTSTLLRLLNDTTQPAVSELAAAPMRALNVRQPSSGGKQPPLNNSHFPALHKAAAAALTKHRRADAPLALVENYKCLGTTPLALICPLLHAESRTGKGSLCKLADLAADAALPLAQPQPGAARLSEAEEAILQGGGPHSALKAKLTDLHATALRGDPTEVQAVLRTFLTPAALGLVSKIHAQGKQRLATSLAAALLRELCGPHAYTYVTRHKDAYLSARYRPHARMTHSLYDTHVGVDGSLRPPTASTPGKGGGAAAFVTAETNPYTGDVTLTAHIATCTYDGDQTVANSEYAGYALALQTLRSSPHLRVGWDHLNAVDLMHAELPETKPDAVTAGPADLADAPALPSTFKHLASAAHYHGNPHMALAHALTSSALGQGNKREVYKVEAHISPEADAQIAALLDGAATWNDWTKEYKVPHATLHAVLRTIATALAARPAPPGAAQDQRTHHLSLALNTLADWGSKQVALKDRAPSVALPPNTLSPGKWCLVSIPQSPAATGSTAIASSAVQQSDPASVRRLITTRVERALQEIRLHPDPTARQPTRLNTANLWVEESTAVLRRPSGKRAGPQAGMPPEQLTKHYCQMTYGSILYNADALSKDPDLAAAQVKGPDKQLAPFATHCTLCAQAGAVALGEDSLHHVYHACTAHAVVGIRHALRSALTSKIKDICEGAIHNAEAAQAADLIMQRPDYYAGQISLDAYNLIAVARARHASGRQAPPGLPGEAHPPAPRTGALQQLVLQHSKQIHDLRMTKIPKELRLTRYRKAMWANQLAATHAAARAAKATASAPPAAAPGGAAGDGQDGA